MSPHAIRFAGAVLIPAMCGGIIIWRMHLLSQNPDIRCIHLSLWPLTASAVSLIAISVAVLLRAHRGWPWLRALLYLFAALTALSIAFLAVFLYIATALSHPSATYELNQFSVWLRGKVERNWPEIWDCMTRSPADNCEEMNQKYRLEKDFLAALPSLSSFEKQCCMPPTVCNYAFVNPTYRTVDGGDRNADPDCSFWSNNQTVLCSVCRSCRAGVAADLRLCLRPTSYWLAFVVGSLGLVGLICFFERE